VNHLGNLMETKKANPYDFDQYWAGTGQTSMIKSLALNNLDPTDSYEVLMKAKKENLDLKLLKQAHSIKDKFLPLNLLLFNTGYFTIKKISDDHKAELDWTNKETKEAFFEQYVDGLGFKVNDLLDSLKVSQSLRNMKIFVQKLNEYFHSMLKKHYKERKLGDHEHNHGFHLFLELMEFLPRSKSGQGDLTETIIYNQYKLNEESEFRRGKIPDLMFAFNDYLHEKKYILFVELYKWYRFCILSNYLTYIKGKGTQNQQH